MPFKIHLSLVALALICSFSACKYPDGPAISFHTKEARIINTWVPEFSFLAGDSATFVHPNGYRYFLLSPYLSCRSITFMEEGNLMIIFNFNSGDSANLGTWALSEDESSILLDFASGWPNSLNWKILHLGNNKLSVEFTYIDYHVEVTLKSA